MLSYRHAFHAGNHADVLKHLVLRQLSLYLGQKEKPYIYIDTHAGAGMYRLDQGYAAKNAEYETGISRLWSSKGLPPALVDYVELIRGLNSGQSLCYYPGSPWVAQQGVRAQDKMFLFELHGSDFVLLNENFADQAKVSESDGFAALKALLPPPSRRALVLIDPPYEDKADYKRVVDALQEALKRFATGVYAVWYPALSRSEVPQMLKRLKLLPAKSWLHVALNVQQPAADGFGMYGSGMFVLNPPWTLMENLQQVMPVLVRQLGQDAQAGFVLEQHEG